MSKDFHTTVDTFALKFRAMRLTAIEKPKNLYLIAAFRYSKWKFGRVLAPLKYIYARSIPILKVSFRIAAAEKKLHLPASFRHMIRYYTSHLNECSFCSDLSEHLARKNNQELEAWQEFSNFRKSDKFSKQQKALLAYLEEINFTKTASEESFKALKEHFSEQEIVEITWLNASENYFNLMAKPLGLKADGLSSFS
jgi:alkylhydroperoxidase family enzyme